MRRNQQERMARETMRRVHVRENAAGALAPAQDAASGVQAGHTDAGTGDWVAAGITNITSTGDPFYSAKG